MAFLVERCGEMVMSMDQSHKPVPAPFLTKTYQLVDDPCTDHIVSWGEDETTFVVWRPPEFARDLLPNYFKHNNFSSFVRQLNTYGFRKIVADRWEFANEFFRKGAKHLLSEIHRRKSTSQLTSPIHYHHGHFHPHHLNHSSPPYHNPDDQMGSWGEPPLLPLPSNTDTDFISALSEDNQRLRRRNSFLLSELTHMKKLYNDIIYFLQNHVTPVPHSQRVVSTTTTTTTTTTPGHCRLLELGSGSCSEKANGTVKLFGVALQGKKRLHEESNGHEGSEGSF
ncbi:heat stress transcription factor B-4b-like isoform X2 [Typha angustifolia]|uniref:heat stress transcription factor B-4b-like n=1 Tax=Typha latifolia TaxID=4733 RepID=UPI003C2DBF16